MNDCDVAMGAGDRNGGEEPRTLYTVGLQCGAAVETQFELSGVRAPPPPQGGGLDLAERSRKAQQTLPLSLAPSNTVLLTVFCNTR